MVVDVYPEPGRGAEMTLRLIAANGGKLPTRIVKGGRFGYRIDPEVFAKFDAPEKATVEKLTEEPPKKRGRPRKTEESD